MKIFLDCTFLRNKHTGVDVTFLSLIPYLLKIGTAHEYTILLDSRYNQEYLLSQIKNYSNYKIKKIYSPLPLQVIYSAFLIPFYLRWKRYNVYHNPYFFGPLLKFICSKTKIVITVHDVYHHTIPHLMNKKLNYIFKLFGDSAIKKADAIIVVSTQTFTDVIKYLAIPTSRLHLVYWALNSIFKTTINHTDYDIREKYKIFNKRYVLTVGKIVPSKGIADLINSFSPLVDKFKYNDILLISVGIADSEYINKIKAQIDSLPIEVKSVIKLLGYVEDKDLQELYINAELIVVPSHYEGFGLPVLEGMRFDKPVIVRNVPSLKEVADNAALFFNTNEELTENMDALLKNKELSKEYVERGKQRLKHFSWENTAEKTLVTYEKRA